MTAGEPVAAKLAVAPSVRCGRAGALRGLLLGTPVGSAPWTELARCGAILAVAVALSGSLFGRRTA